MAMSYSSLTAAKGTAGAIKTWVNYSELDVATIVDEAQTLIYQALRVREMRASTSLSLALGSASVALPAASTGQFLEPVSLRDRTNGATLIPSDKAFVSEQRLLAQRVYSSNILSTGTPSAVAVFDEAFQFNCKASATTTYDLVYYKRPDLLAASTNESNWLTLRYPQLVRAACLAAAADYMKDDAEYAKAKERLLALITTANQEAKLNDSQHVASDLNTAAIEGSLLNFISDSSTPAQTVLAQAQALIYQTLRAREMIVSTPLTLSVGTSSIALPGIFLEPITLRDVTNSNTFIPSDQRFVSQQRLVQMRRFTGATLNSGTPSAVAIFDESFNFDVRPTFDTLFVLVYYKRPALLTLAQNESNFLTLRYPQILRTACQVVSADFRKEQEEYAKQSARLADLIAAANAEAQSTDARSATSDINRAGIDSSLLSFLSDTTTPAQAVLAEAQALLATLLRTREMRAEYAFTAAVGTSYVPLPTGFLDPIGRITETSWGAEIAQKPQNFVQGRRIYTETSGTLGTDPLTVALGSTSVSVALTGHGFTQDSLFRLSGATTFQGVTIAGTFPITSITDDNTFVIDITSLGTVPSGSGSGGGASIAYVCDTLVQAMPAFFGIWNERIYFDCAFNQATTCRLQFYQAPTALTGPAQSNWLTARYPHLFRIACQAAEANMRRDHQSYAAVMAALAPAARLVNVENDMSYRGMEMQTENP